MKSNRLEAFSDGVLAIVITIMVLELKVPHGETLAALSELWPTFVSYILSFVYIGIYWNNHHHIFQAADRVNGAVLWANLHLLFWLSLLPFTTGWMGENHFAALPVALYGADLLLCAAAYYLLERTIIAVEGKDSKLARAVGGDVKAIASLVIYAAGISGAMVIAPWAGMIAYSAVAVMWLIPDRRIERILVS